MCFKALPSGRLANKKGQLENKSSSLVFLLSSTVHICLQEKFLVDKFGHPVRRYASGEALLLFSCCHCHASSAISCLACAPAPRCAR